MGIEDFIRIGDQPPALRFLIIGGHAVGAHGHPRNTYDVDFLIRKAEKDEWLKRIETLTALKKTSEADTFAQFAEENESYGLDLMFVNDETFTKMWDNSEERDFRGTKARIPSLDHLLALKLHALKQGLQHRTYKDADDVEVLARRNKLDLTSPHYQELFLKYGNLQIYETFVRILRH